MKTAALAVLCTTLLAVPAHAGPPHIRVTLRGHPQLGGFVTLTTFHHATQQAMALSGTAEGLVDGRRTSVALRFDAAPGQSGVYAVPRTWGETGVWVLNIGTSEAHGGAGVVVGVDRAGRPAWEITPRTIEGLSRPASAREVESLLASLEAGQGPPQLSRADLFGFVARNPAPAALMLLLATCGLWILARGSRWIVRLARRPRAVAA